MWRILKKILIVILVIGGALVLWALIDSFYQAWQGYKWQKQTDKFQNALEQPYKEDTYGGKTPEETWGMFLDALKKGDIDLASKYYDVAHQEKGKELILKLKQENKLDDWIKELEGLKKSSREALEGEANYYYDYFDEEFKRILSAPVVFYLNPYTKVWKIIY
ncbi:MAG: hypothetical protein AAB797_01295 [Patescibacteria group bacterium]